MASSGVHRHAERLSRDIPQRDVDARERAHHRALLPVVARVVVHAVPEHLDVARVGTEQDGLQRMLDCRGRDLRRLQTHADRLAPAGQAAVGDDLDQGCAARLHPALRKCKWRLQRRRQAIGLDVGDLHPLAHLRTDFAMRSSGKPSLASTGARSKISS